MYFQKNFAELSCQHILSDTFIGDCAQYLSDYNSKMSYYLRCVDDMCYVHTDSYNFCPMCTITADLAHECKRSPGSVDLDWDIPLAFGTNYTLKTECGKFSQINRADAGENMPSKVIITVIITETFQFARSVL